MKKREAELTTKLLKSEAFERFMSDNPSTIWVEVKVTQRPRRFSTKVLSEKAKLMLSFTKLKHKFSDFSRMGTPLDFIYSTNVQPLLCVIFYGDGNSTAYFMEYKSVSPDGGDTLLAEDECGDLALFAFVF